jgi:hypothetical protein
METPGQGGADGGADQLLRPADVRGGGVPGRPPPWKLPADAQRQAGGPTEWHWRLVRDAMAVSPPFPQRMDR